MVEQLKQQDATSVPQYIADLALRASHGTDKDMLRFAQTLLSATLEDWAKAHAQELTHPALKRKSPRT